MACSCAPLYLGVTESRGVEPVVHGGRVVAKSGHVFCFTYMQ
jgi:hypothetical protein